jgi:hypothetical protein
LSLSNDQLAGAYSAIAQLRAKQTAALAWLQAQKATLLPTFGDVDGAILALQTEVQNAIDSLAGPELERANTGDITFDRWVDDASSLYGYIGTYTNDVGVEGAFSALKQIPADTLKDLKDAGNAVKPYVQIGGGIGIAVVLFLAFVYVGGLRG